MFAGSSIPKPWRRVFVAGLLFSMGGSLLFSPPALSSAAASTFAPAADVFDVDFGRENGDDHAQGFAASAVGEAWMLEDSELGRTVASFDGDDSFHYDAFSKAWTDPEYVRPSTAVTQQCTFRYTGESAPAQPQYVCRANNTGGFGIYLNGTNIVANLQTTVNNDWINIPFMRDEWVDIVQTYDGATWTVYVNGERFTTKTRGGEVRVPAQGSRSYSIGSSPANSSWNLVGDVAATRVWSSALSAAHVSALHRGDVEQPSTVTPSIVPMANVMDVDLSRGNADDQAHGMKATSLGEVTIVRDADRDHTIARFNGTDSGYRYDEFASVWTDTDKARPTTAFTQQCTFKYTGESIPSGPQYICRGNNTGGFGIYIDGAVLTVNLQTTTSNSWISSAFQVGEWVDAVQTYDGSTWSLYANGELVATAQRDGEIQVPQAASRPFTLGYAPANDSWFFEGDIAASRVWDAALTPYQVAALFNGSGDVPPVGLIETVPSAGQHIAAEVVFEARLHNPHAATAWRYMLDGEPIAPGDVIGPELSAGAHKIEITAVGPRGENRKWRVPFTSEVMPTGGGTQTGQDRGAVTLSAIASNPDGGQVSTTFNEALVSTAGAGFQGVLDAIPATLEFQYTDGAEITGTQVPDGALTVGPTARKGKLIFQRFDIEVPASESSRDVVWSGVMERERLVSLWAWSAERDEWVKLASSRGQTEGDTVLRGALRGGFDEGGVARVMVVAEDPFADDLSPRDASANLPESRDRFEKPEDYAFAVAHISDTQNLSQIVGNVCPQYNPGAQEVARKSYMDMTEWIARNSAERKIAYTAHTGDLIESRMTSYPALCQQNAEQVEAEFAFVNEAQRVLEDADLVNSVLAGNHDNANGTDNGANTAYNEHFGAERYYAASQAWPDDASYHPWDEELNESGEVVKPGVDNDNHYVLFSAGGLDFVAVSLSFGVTAAEADWASSIFTRFAERSGILLTHAYLGASTQPDGRSAAYTGDGGMLSDRVVSQNSNVFLVLSGHVHGVGTNVDGNAGVKIDRNHGVVEILADYQEYRVPASQVWSEKVLPGGGIDLNGDGVAEYQNNDGIILGASFLRLLQIDVENATMSVDTYSPFLNNFGATEYDGSGRYNGAEDNFVVPIDLPTRTTTVVTDGLSVVTPTDAVIGISTVSSGWPASVRWTGLEQDRLYAWTATSSDPSGAVLGVVNQFGSLFRATAAGTDTVAPVLTVPDVAVTEVGSDFDPLTGVSALDNIDGDLTSAIQVLGSVDILTPGAYALQYVVADANGNQATALRAVTVTDKKAPVDPAEPGEPGAPGAPTAANVTLGTSIVSAGGELMLLGSGFDVNEALMFELMPASRSLGETTAEEDGSFATTVRVPRAVIAGDYTVSVIRADGSTIALPVTIVGESQGSESVLATTGMAAPIAVMVTALLLIVAGMVLVRRRRLDRQS